MLFTYDRYSKILTFKNSFHSWSERCDLPACNILNLNKFWGIPKWVYRSPWREREMQTIVSPLGFAHREQNSLRANAQSWASRRLGGPAAQFCLAQHYREWVSESLWGVSVSEEHLCELSVESIDSVPLVMNYGSNFINFFTSVSAY